MLILFISSHYIQLNTIFFISFLLYECFSFIRYSFDILFSLHCVNEAEVVDVIFFLFFDISNNLLLILGINEVFSNQSYLYRAFCIRTMSADCQNSQGTRDLKAFRELKTTSLICDIEM